MIEKLIEIKSIRRMLFPVQLQSKSLYSHSENSIKSNWLELNSAFNRPIAHSYQIQKRKFARYFIFSGTKLLQLINGLKIALLKIHDQCAAQSMVI